MTGYEGLHSHAAWIDVSDRGKIRVTGEDRARLLHAMSTNDINNLPSGQGLYAFFLNDKGRILADAYIYNLGNALFLDTEPETGEKLRDHLDRYIIADDAELSDETNAWAAIGLAGPNSFELASELGIPLPESNYGILGWTRGFVIRLQSIRVFVHVEAKQEFVSRLESANIPQASPEEARIVRIENGIPRYGEEISERYLVQETGVTHAVHFNKGCYLGQEIVERVRSRGQVHRVLRSVRIESTHPPAPGTKLSVGGKDVAEIASAVYSPTFGAVAALAYVRTEAAQSKPDLVVSGSEPPIRAQLLTAATA
jgi:tRNA-modifying protein YgfZ